MDRFALHPIGPGCSSNAMDRFRASRSTYPWRWSRLRFSVSAQASLLRHLRVSRLNSPARWLPYEKYHKMKLIDTLSLHKSQPEIDFGTYAKGRKILLGKGLSNFTKIYLDTNYWILLCDAYLGREKNELQIKLLQLIFKLHESGQFLFPISEDIFLEVIKQTDASTLSTTVKLIDKFSKGITLLSAEERFQLEFFHFIDEKSGENVYQLEQLVWSKLPYTMGLLTPTNKKLSKDTNNLIQKAFLDQMWSMSLSDMVSQIGYSELSTYPRMSDIAEKLNRDKFAHADENKSFKQMFLTELAGILDINKSMFEKVMIFKYEKIYKQKLTTEEYSKSNIGQTLANVVYNSFKLNKVDTELPSYRIISGLYAAVRWNTEQGFEQNDMHDFRHAAAALPYARFFFTERKLCHLITQKMLAYDRLFSCKVAWRLTEVVALIEGIISQQVN